MNLRKLNYYCKSIANYCENIVKYCEYSFFSFFAKHCWISQIVAKNFIYFCMYRKRHRCVLTRAWATLVARPQAYRILLLQMYEYSLCARPGGQLGLLWVTSPWMITLHVPDDGMTPSGGGPRDWYVPSSLSLGGHLRITLHLQMVPLAWQRIGQHQIFTCIAYLNDKLQ